MLDMGPELESVSGTQFGLFQEGESNGLAQPGKLPTEAPADLPGIGGILFAGRGR